MTCSLQQCQLLEQTYLTQIEKFFDSQQQADAGNGQLDVKDKAEQEDADYEEGEEEEPQHEPK